jgi:signal transduction histidine kinase
MFSCSHPPYVLSLTPRFIHFCVRYSGGQAIVQFRNSSTGLPGRLVERIGELDYQSTRDDNPAGAVIHFALLKKLIDMHGGTLAVESTAVTDSVSDSEYKRRRRRMG